jgi:IrrE N-terminal-like domain
MVMAATRSGYPTLPMDRKKEIASLAEAVSENYGTQGRIDPASVIRANDVTLNFGRYADAFDGMLEHLDGRFHVYCNLDRVEKEDSTRARFTLGHELGHFYIDDHRNALASGAAPSHSSFAEFESKLLVEQEADHFAVNLLMPETLFRKRTKGNGPGLSAILELAKSFKTSVSSTAIRYASLGVSPCVVIKWNPNKVAWKWIGDELWSAGFRKIIDDKIQVIDGSATAKAFSDERTPPKGYFESATTCAYWFPNVNLGGWKDELLIEHAKALGRFGVITVLYPESGSILRRG